MIKVGEEYYHHKTGHLYTVLSIGIYCGEAAREADASDVEDGEPMEGFVQGTEFVVYVGHYDNPRGNRVYLRPASDWEEGVFARDFPHLPDGARVPRFVLKEYAPRPRT